VLVAGLGNIFFGDDGFGVEVVKRLKETRLPDGVSVGDFGIRGIHLAYELLDGGHDVVVLVDATSRGGTPGTVYLLEPRFPPESGPGEAGPTDAHGMGPDAVLAWLARMGGTCGRVLVVGCEPARMEEEMGLSEPVSKAVDEAVKLILEVVEREGRAATGPAA
jgi:hydrogenase maturation protease